MSRSDEQWRELWRNEAARPVQGWDWSHLNRRRLHQGETWHYDDLAYAALGEASSALDLGTGGGERLAGWVQAFPERMVATEGWPPNVEIARKRLVPLGVAVHATEKHVLPFDDRSFDLVLNRRASYRADEIARVLMPGGLLLTEQMDSASRAALGAHFGRQVDAHKGTLAQRTAALETAGLIVETAGRDIVRYVYEDVGTLVYHLAGMPWTVPKFSVDGDLAHLLALQRRIDRGEVLSFDRGVLLIRARRPAAP